MKTRYRFAAALFALLLLVGAAHAQPLEVSGTVTDATTGQPIPGASVVVATTTIGTTTDGNGRYRLAIPPDLGIPPDQRRLRYSFVGFQSREIALPAGTTTLNVELEEDVLGLEEVVVTGLATTVKRSNLANAVATISGRELSGVTTSQTFDTALSGKVPGALISSYSGAPGGGISVKLRGISTINGNSQPLYIIDGVILDNSAIQSGVDAVSNATGGGGRERQDNPVNRIADLNPEDIESIEILKGASAAALYGSSGSNGVVIIQTKRGTAGQTRVNFSQDIGVTSMLNPLGVRQFTADTAEEFFGARGREEFVAAQNGRGFIDYEEELYGNDGLLLNTSLSVSGGNESTQFFVSGLLKDDEGIVENTGYEKQSIRANITHSFSQRARFTVTSNYIRSEAARGLTGNDNSGTTFGISLAATPNFVELRPDANGIYPDHPFNTANPLQTRDLMTNREKVNRFIGSGRLSYNLFQNDKQVLQVIGEGGFDYYSLTNNGYFPNELQFERINADGRGVGTSVLREADNFNTNWRALLVHTYSVPGSLALTTQGGLTGANFDQDAILLTADGLIPGQSSIDQAAALDREQTIQFQKDRSFFIQEEANFNDRVILTAGLRGDKSTINGDIDTFNLFPKLSAAVNVTNFGFFTAEAFEQLKLRVAWGQTGNIARFGTKYTSFNPVAIGGAAGTLIDRRRGYDEVEPERQTEIEGGLDVTVYDGRASLEFTAYRKVVKDMLLEREVEPSTGYALETFNGGELVNVGVEVGLTLLPINNRTVRWLSRTSFWTNEAEVTELPVPAFRAIGGGFGATLGEIRIEEGKSPTQIVGIDDTDGDGTADGTFLLGDTAPDFQMSFFNEFTVYRNFSFTVFAHWKQGGQNLNLTELLTDLFGTSPDFGDDDDGDGVSNGNERLGQLGVSAKPFVQDAGYFRIREIGLYYTVPQAQLQSFLGENVRGLRLGVSAKNPFLWSPYKSYDPEVNNFATVPVSDGVEVTPFPSSRSLMFHLGVSL